MDLTQVIKRAVVTEKSMQETSFGRYAFAVDKRATKKEIAAAVEKFFGVHVTKVNTMTGRGKTRRPLRWRQKIKEADWKKAIVQLKEGEKIEVFETGE